MAKLISSNESAELADCPKNLHLINHADFPPISLVDCDAKEDVARYLIERGVRVHRVPWGYDLVKNQNTYDGIILSNRPGDPENSDRLKGLLRQLLGVPNSTKPGLPDHQTQASVIQPVWYDSSLRGENIITVEMFDRSLLRSLFNLAERYIEDRRNNRPNKRVMSDKVMVTALFEPMTVTELCLPMAMTSLGGREKKFDLLSSENDGRADGLLEHTISKLTRNCHVVVLRHPQPDAVARAAELCDVPVINAGAGTGENPTQALLDVFTIRKELGTVSNLVISLVGDLKNESSVHSLAKLLCNYDIGELRLVSPEGLEMPEEICHYLNGKRVPFVKYGSLEDVVEDSDVIYMTQFQRERFESEEEYKRCLGRHKITQSLLVKAKAKMIVMHPLPRFEELNQVFDNDSRSAFPRQIEYGLYVHMALLAMVVNK